MKKLITLLLTLSLIIACSGCDQKKTETIEETDDTLQTNEVVESKNDTLDVQNKKEETETDGLKDDNAVVASEKENSDNKQENTSNNTTSGNTISNNTSKPSSAANTQTNNNSTTSNNSKTDTTSGKKEDTTNNISTSQNKKGHYETQTVLVSEAYDEQVLVAKGACHDELVTAAWDEEVIEYGAGAYYGAEEVEVMVCNECGEVLTNGAHEHTDSNGIPHLAGYHNEYHAIEEPYWHNVTYKTVHHDAVYNTVCDPDKYKTVHHDAQYKEVQVWVED